MSTAYFIAQRIRKADQAAFSTLAHKIGVISVALGLAIVLLGFLVLGGFQHNIENKLMRFQGQIQVYQYALNRTQDELPISTAKIAHLKQTLGEALASIQPYAHKTMLLKAGEDLEGVICKGVDPVLAQDRLQNYLTAGRFIAAAKTGYSQEIVLGKSLARKLQVKVGDTVTACILQHPPRYRKLAVVGIYATYLEELDEAFGFCDLQLIQRLNAWPDSLVGGYEFFLRDPQQSLAIGNQILDHLDYDLTMKRIEETYPAIFDWLLMMRKDVVIFLSLILLVAATNIISIVLIQLMERTKMMGILKALGATDRLIRYILVWHNLYLVFKGMIWGNAIGLGLGALQSYTHFLKLDPTYYYTPYVPIAWNGWVILGLNIGVFVLVSLVLLIAVMLTAKLRPITAMRLE